MRPKEGIKIELQRDICQIFLFLFVVDCLQVICSQGSISQHFLYFPLNFRGSKKRATDGQTLIEMAGRI